ncbi:MAG: tyrosine--tRNA ligase [Bacilli bacterium]|nr:tyrosine--tRNA ligase [Bacilli bacterium]
MKIYDELLWRGLIKDFSDPALIEKLNNGGMTFYIGTDPTGDSMHIGHFSSFLIATRLKKAGHNPILLVGGATGQIGDPKPTAERAMITKQAVAHNVECLTNQAKKIFGFEVVNNYDWCKDINFIDFLRDYGKYFNVSYMLNKDIVRRRLELGITYTEFSYMIMQALDFLHLYETRNCTMQVAGQDQWGNITAGIELIRKKIGKEAYGFTMPLITKSDGTKFGKTEGNAIWLDINKTSSYEMFQFFINVEDSMVIDYLKKLTFLSKEEIEEIEKEHNVAPEKRRAHKKLAEEVITFLHGHEEYEKALKISEALFTEDIVNLSANDIIANFKDVKQVTLTNEENIIDVLVNNGICSSKREAREMVTGNAISINNKKVTDVDLVISKSMAIDEKVIIIKKGKKNYYLAIFA